MSGSIRVYSDANKKPRVTDTDNNCGDIISNLPESVISHILSLLPTKDVLRTCVLSKDWEYKWTSIYNIDIDDGERFSLKTTRKTSVVNFVDRILLLSRNSTLKSFRLSCSQNYSSRRMITWISAVLMSNVQNMEIVYNHEGVVLPRCLFDCTSLTKLKLHLPCIFRVPVRNWFSNLRILYLVKVEILNEYFPNTSQLMFTFPVLESFELEDCRWLKVNFVEINAPALNKFKVKYCSDIPEVDDCQIKISGAKLAMFELSGHFLENFDLSASSVVFAAIQYYRWTYDLQVIKKNGLQARLLLKGFSGLNYLELSGEIVEAIAQSKQGLPLPIFYSLKQLELCSRCNSEAFLELLHVAPSLEVIILDVWLWDDYDYDTVELVPSCIVSRLNEVRFRRFCGTRPQVHLADFLLKNAVELKKMLGLARMRSEKRRLENNFWANLKRVFDNDDFVVGSCVKNMSDFEYAFG